MPEKEKGSQEPARVFGESMGESFASYDQATLSWKTSQLCLLEGSTLYSETWPRAGMMRNGTSYRLQPLAPRTSGKGSGLWPTPRTQWPTPTTDSAQDRQKKYAQGGTPLTMAVKMWPTPRANDNDQGYRGEGSSWKGQARGETLHNAVKRDLWPTPRAADFKGAVNPSETTARRVETGEANLPEAVVESQRWQTPVADDAVEQKDGKYNSRGEPKLSAQVKMWATPCAVSWKGCGQHGSKSHTADVAKSRLKGQVMEPGNTGQLNPTWVEWLMGYPLGFTDLEDSATP